MIMSRRVTFVLAVLPAVAALAWAAFAPYLYPEYELLKSGREAAVLPPLTGAITGRWFDDYFVIEDIDGSTFAIGEPRYYQGNYSYLLLGEKRAVLYDAGTGTRDIVPVVRSLTALPVTVIPSHLHFDHVGALGRFERTALLDDPSLRRRARTGRLTLERYEFLGFWQDLPPPTFRVDDWWAADSRVDLGGRTLQVWSTPGHTPTSVSLYDADRGQLFAGDFIYPAHLYAFLPGSSRGAYLATTRRVLGNVDPGTRIFCAHMEGIPAPLRAPALAVADLRALEATLSGLQAGIVSRVPPHDFPTVLGYPVIYPVRGSISFATGYPWNNR